MLEDLGKVIQDKEADTRLVRGPYDKIKPFLIEGKLQQEDLLDAFMLDDSLKHQNVGHTRHMQHPCVLMLILIIIDHRTADAESKSSSLFDPFGHFPRFVNRTDQQCSLRVCPREEMVGQLARQYMRFA